MVVVQRRPPRTDQEREWQAEAFVLADLAAAQLSSVRRLTLALGAKVNTLRGELPAALPAAAQSALAAWQAAAAQIGQALQDAGAEVARARRHADDAPDQAPQVAGSLRLAGQVAQDLLAHLAHGAMDLARLARTYGDVERARAIVDLAEQAAGHAPLPPPPAGQAKPGAHHKSRLAFVTGIGDAINNATSGAVGGGVGMVEAISGAKVFGAVGSAVGGGLGVLFGSFAVFLGLNAFFRGRASEKQLRALVPQLGGDLKALAGYAAGQKHKKKLGGTMVVAAGGLAIVAGILGLVAISVGTLGAGAAALGLLAAMVGLGFVIGKWLHGRAKRQAEAERLASAVVTAARGPNPDADAVATINAKGEDPTWAGSAREPELVKALAGKLRNEAKSKRQETAESLYASLTAGTPTQQFDTELVLVALHLDPDALRTYRPDKAKDEIARKLSSW